METDKRCSIHPDAKAVLEVTPAIKHYGKWVCDECGKFVVWAKNPKTSQAMRDRQVIIATIIGNLRSSSTMTVKDIKFLCTIYTKVHLNPFETDRYRSIITAPPPV